jgi:hypothetical protein
MRLEAVIDSFYVLGSLWGVPTGPRVCTSYPDVLPRRATHEPARSPGPEARAGVTAFVDVNVVPMDQERVLANQTVLVEGGKITALGPSSQVKVPVGAVRVDGRGKYLMPGLTDMHHHLWGAVATGGSRIPSPRIMQDSLFRELAGGVTAVRFPEGIHQDRQRWLDVLPARTEEVPTPHIYWPAPEIPVSTRPDSVAAIVAAAKAAGYDFIGTPPSPRVDPTA